MDPVARTPTGQRGHACAGDHRLRGGAPAIDTGAAEVVPLDERYLPPRLGEGDGEEPASLTGPDDDHIIGGGRWHGSLLHFSSGFACLGGCFLVHGRNSVRYTAPHEHSFSVRSMWSWGDALLSLRPQEGQSTP